MRLPERGEISCWGTLTIQPPPEEMRGKHVRMPRSDASTDTIRSGTILTMDEFVIVQVPEGDADDLAGLAAIAAEDEDVQMIHPFDGDTVAQILVVLSATTLPFFKTWMSARLNARKSIEVVRKGTKIKGASADDVVNIMQALSRN